MVAELSRAISNLGGPRLSKVILYVSPVWKHALRFNKYRKLLERLNREMGLKIIAPYRTVSADATVVLTGSPPEIWMNRCPQPVQERTPLINSKTDVGGGGHRRQMYCKKN